MKNLLTNSETSMVKFCVDLAEEMVAEGLSPKIEYVEVDSRVELKDAELPDCDIIGLTQFSISEPEAQLWAIHFVVVISTISDVNLFRLRKLANFIYERLPAGADLVYYDAEAATEKSWIRVIPGTTQLPTHRVETRPFRFIQAQALLDPLQGSAQTSPDPVP